MIELCYETINRSPFITPGFEADLPAQMRAAAAAGFRWTGLDLASIDQYLERGGSLASLRRLLDDEGLHCFELQPLIVSLDPEETSSSARRVAEIASHLEVPWVQSGLVGDLDEAMVERFRERAAIVAEANASIALEYLPFNALKSIADTRRFIAESGVDNAGIVVDCWHFFYGPDEWSDLEGLSLDELAYPQFDDAPPLGSDDLMFETTQRRLLPGDGSFDLERYCRILIEKGYDGPVSVEILSAEMRSWSPEDFARGVFESSSSYWVPSGSHA
ncbi:MAG: sugar phosphate isomerase/epimerase [Deltaproteobacteria bacterium]|jgi:sugar phosphate isomerase/epimerase|nr:sugar phosphate isomerase/epimerase [Deltaproteobacteria bacterium]